VQRVPLTRHWPALAGSSGTATRAAGGAAGPPWGTRPAWTPAASGTIRSGRRRIPATSCGPAHCRIDGRTGAARQSNPGSRNAQWGRHCRPSRNEDAGRAANLAPCVDRRNRGRDSGPAPQVQGRRRTASPCDDHRDSARSARVGRSTWPMRRCFARGPTSRVGGSCDVLGIARPAWGEDEPGSVVRPRFAHAQWGLSSIRERGGWDAARA